MPELPSGTVTFLFTDLEVSTRLWDQEPEAMSGALARHDEILRAAVETQDGVVVKGRGDGFHAVFATADAAVRAAVECELAMSAQLWPVSEPLRARIGIHTGVAELRDDDYFGSAVNRAARLEAIAHGGQILCSETTADLARDALPEAVDLIDLGEHRLRDLSRPERVFQVIAPGLAGDFPPLRSLDAFPGNLPRQLTSFVGRDEEVASLAAALTEASLVTVTGVGGVGKTRLAMQVAADVAPRFTDGAWLCELATALDAESLVQVVASTLGVAPRQGLTLEGSIREYLRAKQILVVLDNCEHLLRAAGDLAEGLLVDCPGVQLLATSREGLAIAGEQVWPLRALGIPREAATTADVSASDAARLFVERARAARPSFALDDTNAQAVSEICRRLDGIPLAIELAAARVSALRPREIASLLDERFRLLTGGRRTAIERHQTLRATVDWSYSLLDERERLVFERLGVFVGGFDVAAASAVVDGAGVERWDIVDALGELVAKSMLTTDDEPTATTRYKMFETIRAYAHERLDESGSADVWRRRHAEHFADFAEVAGPELAGADELTWRPRLHDELDNLRAAVGWALDRDDPADQDLALRVIAALANQSYLGRAAGISAWAVRALPHAEQSPPGRRTAVLAAAAQDVIYQGDYAGGRALGIDALRDGLTADCPAPYLAYLAIAECDTFHGKHREALTTMAQAHAAIDAIGGDAFSTSAIRCAEAVFTAMSGDFDNARPQADEALRLARKLGNPSNLAMALFALGSAHWEDDPQRAVAALDESIAFTRAGASAIMFGPALSLAARVHARTGTHTRALESLRESILACADTGDRPALFSVLDRGIEVLAAVGDADGAAVLAGIVTVGPFRDLTSLQGGPEEEARGRIIEGLRAELGVDRFTATTARGAAMSYDELIDYSLGQVDRLMSEAGHSIT